MKSNALNNDWLFYKYGCEHEAIHVELPHDAMIAERRISSLANGSATGFFPGGKYVYEKEITGQEGTVILEFGGVYMNSAIYLDGERIGGRLYGYSNFFVDLSGRLKDGQNGLLRVVADNSATPNSRWYSGSGIYRPVTMWTGSRSYIKPEGLRVKTLSIDPAMIEVCVDTENAEGFVVAVEVLYGEQVVASGTGENCVINIPGARLWSADEPNLYTLKAYILRDHEQLDEAEIRFGIRTLAWDVKRGFQVNGKTTKLRGGCVHHDHGILGACEYRKAEYRRVKMLKMFGLNAIRYSHNPAGKAFLDACDEIGMYVIDESFDQWKVPQSACDYSLHFDAEWQRDVDSLVSKDYSHPCVVMYGVGNEITDTGLPWGAGICRAICERFKQLDDSRPTMLAINAMLATLAAMKAKQAACGEEDTVGSKEVNDIVALLPQIMASITPESLETIVGECAECVDIVGYNYGANLYDGIHALAPERVVLSSETFPARFASDWDSVMQRDYVIGCFPWTAWDYLGEAGVGQPIYGTSKAPFSKHYPCQNAGCGAIDLTGFPESTAYYSAILWGTRREPYIGVRPVNHAGEEYALGNWRMTDSVSCWSWPGYEDQKAEIEVFGCGALAELWQNGNLIGSKPLEHSVARFETEYKPGMLVAVCKDENGVQTGRTEIKTASEETLLSIIPEENVISAGDIVYVPVHLTDHAGVLKMNENKRIHVEVCGAGRLIALGSANPETEDNYLSDSFESFNGRVLAIVKSDICGGEIHVKVSAQGVPDNESLIIAK